MPDPEPYEPKHLSGNAPSDLAGRDGAALERVVAAEARRHLGGGGPRRPRAPLAGDDRDRRRVRPRRRRPHRSGAGGRRRPGRDRRREVPAPLARRGRPEARQGDRHVLDLHGRARSQRLDLHGEDRRVDRRRHGRGDVGRGRRPLRAAARRRAGAGAADARRGRRARATPRATSTACWSGTSGSWASAIASTAPRTRGRGCCERTAQELGSPRFEVAEELERVALAALREYKPDRPLETNVEFWSAVVLDVAKIPHDLTPAMFACARVAGWSAHILEEKRTGRLIRPSAQYVGPAARPASAVDGAPVPT